MNRTVDKVMQTLFLLSVGKGGYGGKCFVLILWIIKLKKIYYLLNLFMKQSSFQVLSYDAR